MKHLHAQCPALVGCLSAPYSISTEEGGRLSRCGTSAPRDAGTGPGQVPSELIFRDKPTAELALLQGWPGQGGLLGPLPGLKMDSGAFLSTTDHTIAF